MTSSQPPSAPQTELSFLCPPELAGHIPYPTPAAHHLPDWIRAIPQQLDIPRDEGPPLRSMAACLPLADAFALGWMLPLPFDLSISRDQMGQLVFEWPEGVPFRPVELLHPAQIGGEQGRFPGELPLSFTNPWRVKLPAGWSAAVLHPLNHFELPFTCFDAVVDFDVLERPVNIPFRWTTPRHDQVVLPAGTPMAQIVPFERRLAPPVADIRAETPDEVAARAYSLSGRLERPTEYERKWYRRHETEGT